MAKRTRSQSSKSSRNRLRMRRNGIMYGAALAVTIMLIIFFSAFVLNQRGNTESLAKKNGLEMPNAVRTPEKDFQKEADHYARATFDIHYRYSSNLNVGQGESLALVFTTDGGEPKTQPVDYKQNVINMAWIEQVYRQYVTVFLVVLDRNGKQTATGPSYTFEVPPWQQRSLPVYR